jgi:hypothetical protein
MRNTDYVIVIVHRVMPARRLLAVDCGQSAPVRPAQHNGKVCRKLM